ncbi:MAG: NAD-dependent epimerase/dehydratase family protein [Anaerolineae bacterium]
MPETLLVTGATGFLGRHLLPALCRKGYAVRALVRDPEAHLGLVRYPNVMTIHGDVLDAPSLERALDGVDNVIHAAGRFRFWGRDSDFWPVNVDGTRHVMQAARAAGVRRIVHVSTIAVIGQPELGRWVDEEHSPHPADPYQRSKLAGEEVVREAVASGLDAVIVRPGAFYGPLGEYGFNRLFFRDPMRGVIMQMDYGRHIIFPAYVPDVASGAILALEHGRTGEIYNLCDAPITHRSAFDAVCSAANLHWPRISVPGWMGIATGRAMEAISRLTGREPFYPMNLRSYVYNDWRVTYDKAARELGFAPTPFVEGARRTIAWYRAGRPDRIAEAEC